MPRTPGKNSGESVRAQDVASLLHIGAHLAYHRRATPVLHLSADPSVQYDADLDALHLEVVARQH